MLPNVRQVRHHRTAAFVQEEHIPAVPVNTRAIEFVATRANLIFSCSEIVGALLHLPLIAPFTQPLISAFLWNHSLAVSCSPPRPTLCLSGTSSCSLCGSGSYSSSLGQNEAQILKMRRKYSKWGANTFDLATKRLFVARSEWGANMVKMRRKYAVSAVLSSSIRLIESV